MMDDVKMNWCCSSSLSLQTTDEDNLTLFAYNRVIDYYYTQLTSILWLEAITTTAIPNSVVIVDLCSIKYGKTFKRSCINQSINIYGNALLQYMHKRCKFSEQLWILPSFCVFAPTTTENSHQLQKVRSKKRLDLCICRNIYHHTISLHLKLSTS